MVAAISTPSGNTQRALLSSTPNLMSADTARFQMRRYFEHLTHGSAPDELLGIFSLGDKTFKTFKHTHEELDAAISYVLKRQDALIHRNDLVGIYAQQGMGVTSPESGRWKSADITSAGVIFADMDFGKVGTPDTAQEVLALIAKLPLAPSMIVCSGGGFYPYYLLNQRVDNATFSATSERFIDAISRLLVAHGYNKTDAVKDQTRILRIPGTLNGKQGQLRQAYLHRELLNADGQIQRYTLEEVEQAIAQIEAQYPPVPSTITRLNVDEVDFASLAPANEIKTDDEVLEALRFVDVDAYRSLHEGYPVGRDQSTVDLGVWKGLVKAEASETQILRIVLRSEMPKTRQGAEPNKLSKPDYQQRTYKRACAELAAEEAQRLQAEIAAEEAEPVEIAAPALPVMSDDAFYGLAGEYVRFAEPFTEAHPAAMLVDFLTRCGAGLFTEYTTGEAYSGPHMRISSTLHTPLLFSAIVGDSSNGKKGESANMVRPVFESAESEAHLQHAYDEPVVGKLIYPKLITSVSSGEGLIYQVRDRKTTLDAKTQEEIVVDAGTGDKRLLLQVSEFANLLAAMSRQGNTVNGVLRDMWDGIPTLEVNTKNNALSATGTHIGILAHITPSELREKMSTTDVRNGFGNRFLWVYSQRTKIIARPKTYTLREYGPYAKRLSEALWWAKSVGEMQVDEAAWDYYEPLYARYSGQSGESYEVQLTTRAAPYIWRLAMIYALLDQSKIIKVEHVRAAVAVVEYSIQTVRYVWGNSTGNKLADAIVEILRNEESGKATRTSLNKTLSGGHVMADDISNAIKVLVDQGRVREESVKGKGRPTIYVTMID